MTPPESGLGFSTPRNSNEGGAKFRPWDAPVGWVNLGLPVGFAFDQWHNLAITATGGTFEYRLDGALLYTALTGSTPGVTGLQTVFLKRRRQS